MKFGRQLPQFQVPEWSSTYLDYKGLKKLIKAAVEDTKAGKTADLAEFFFSLDRNLEDIDSFYDKKFSDGSRRLKLLQDRYGSSQESLNELDLNDIDEYLGGLLELREQLAKLQSYGEVNRRGFLKITKKVDKKVPHVRTQHRYMATKVDPKAFASNTSLIEAQAAANDLIEILGNINLKHDAISVHSAHSLKRVSSRSILNLPHGLLDTVDGAIKTDDVPILKETILEANLDSTDPAMQVLLVNLLQRAISCKSKLSVVYFLKQIKSLDAGDDINQRNCLHRLVISIGRAKSLKIEDMEPTAETHIKYRHLRYMTPAMSPPTGLRPADLKELGPESLGMKDEHVELLAFVLDKLEPSQRKSIVSIDTYGRTPLHYAAQFGFVVICEILMKRMQAWDVFNVAGGIDAPEWQDNEGLAPLHLSVIGGHTLTTKALLHQEDWKGVNPRKVTLRKAVSRTSAVLALATKSNSIQIVKLLVQAGVDINWQDKTGETALHTAARFGHEACARLLLDGTDDQKADFELPENNFAWTPLHVACVDGNTAVAELLISVGADLNKPDASGWIAREHAALRGHIALAQLLAEAAVEKSENRSDNSSTSGKGKKTPPNGSSIQAPRSGAITKVESVKSFGHRYLTNESMILVSLGSMDMRKDVPAVKLDRVPTAKALSTQLDTPLSVVVSARGASGEPTIIDLPVQGNISTEPMAFTAADASKVQLYFDIVPTLAGSQDRKIGRGVAILASIRQAIGVKRTNLQGDISVPIIGTADLEVIGCVNFNFLIITPFSHPNMGVNTEQTYWRELTSTMIIGHRGLGKNVTSNKSLQLGENTLQSFIAATNLGASYVEFDVQLTKDLVPVIYHDFLVSETGIDAPVHTLTLEQFLHVNDAQNNRPPSPPKDSPQFRALRGMDRQRSLSMGHDMFESAMSERMKHTRDFKEKGFKGNSRGNFIQAPFTTLEEMFLKLPLETGFNIEMKYPMLYESEEHEMDTYAVELNTFVDTVLKKVYDLGKTRKIIFSSFNPDICLLLSFKQPSIPILFLTDAGASPVGDIRASSLQEAIRFASRWNLLGVVSSAEPFCNSPRLVRVVKDSGLVCVSYGVLNNDPDQVQLQADEGIDAVIVDSVLRIRNGLTKASASSSKTAATTVPLWTESDKSVLQAPVVP